MIIFSNLGFKAAFFITISKLIFSLINNSFTSTIVLFEYTFNLCMKIFDFENFSIIDFELQLIFLYQYLLKLNYNSKTWKNLFYEFDILR